MLPYKTGGHAICESLNSSSCQILTKDSASVKVDAVVFYKFFNVDRCMTRAQDVKYSTGLLAATTLRKTLGTMNLAHILTDRQTIAAKIQVTAAVEYLRFKL